MANFRNQPRAGLSKRSAQSTSRGGRKRARLGRKALKLAALLVLAGLGWAIWEQIPAREPGPLFPIGYVRVEGEIENLDLKKVREALSPAINGGYFSQDLGEIEGALRSIAWVDEVRLTRIWPDTLEIKLTEHKAVARWGDRALLNPRGERFAPGGIEAFAQLPVIYGPSGMERYLLGMLRKLNERVGQKGARVVSLDMSKRRAWMVKLDNGLELHFGRQEPIKTLERFLGLVPRLGENAFARLRRVDLRYPNGFAVVWKSEAEGGDESGAGFQLNGKASNLALEN